MPRSPAAAHARRESELAFALARGAPGDERAGDATRIGEEHPHEPSAVSTWTFDGRVPGPIRQRRQVRGGAGSGALARRLCLPELRLGRARVASFARGTPLLAVRRLPAPVQRHQRHDLRVHQAGAVALVPGHAPAHPVQEQRLGAGAQRHLGVCYQTAWLLKHKLMEVMRVREDAASSTAGWRSTMPTSVVSARVASADADRRTRCRSSPRCRPPRGAAAVRLPASSRSPPRRWRCSRPNRCYLGSRWSPTACGAFAPSRSSAPSTSAIVTGSGKASAELPQFKAINTLLGNLKTAIDGHLPRLRLRQVRPSLPLDGIRTSLPAVRDTTA